MAFYKCVLIGDFQGSDDREGRMAPGKTSLVKRLMAGVEGVWLDSDDVYKPTIVADYSCVNLRNNHAEATLHLWDTSDKERYRTQRTMRIQGAEIVLYCVDFSVIADLEKIKREIGDIKGGGIAPNATIILVATKCDLYVDATQAFSRQLSSTTGVDLCILTSAKTGVGVVEGEGQTLSDLILANLPAEQAHEAQAQALRTSRFLVEYNVNPLIPYPLVQNLLQTLGGDNLTRKQRYQIMLAIDNYKMAMSNDVSASQLFMNRCHAALEGKHLYIMNAVYALVGAVVVAGITAAAGIGFGVPILPVALLSGIWGTATGGIIAYGLFSRTAKQVASTNAVLDAFVSQVTAPA